MGENAFLYRQEHKYPGLVRPYSRDNGSIDPSVIDSGSRRASRRDVSNDYTSRMNGLRAKQKYDPFSRYDDDRGEEHYFLVPKVQGNTLKICEWRKTVQTSRSLRNIAKLASDNKLSESLSQDGSMTYPPYARTKQNVGNSITDPGDYCYISSSEKNSNNLKRNPSSNLRMGNSSYNHKDGERLKDFASKFASREAENPKPQRTHSFSEGNLDTWVELEGISGSKINSAKVRTRLDDTIDYCSCMVCVKGIYYHCTKDDEDDEAIDNPCSCVGSKSSVMKRWTCLAFLACLMPCLFCYLPGRGCANLCRKCQKDSDSNSNLKVRYKKPDRRKFRETTNLL